jgi:hypothetical protein
MNKCVFIIETKNCSHLIVWIRISKKLFEINSQS